MNAALFWVRQRDPWYWGFSYFFIQLLFFPLAPLVAPFSPFADPGRMEWIGIGLFLGVPVMAMLLTFLPKARRVGQGMVTASIFNWIVLLAIVIFALISPHS